jgi:hypothetical protein
MCATQSGKRVGVSDVGQAAGAGTAARRAAAERCKQDASLNGYTYFQRVLRRLSSSSK